jgi:hypothetical protein
MALEEMEDQLEMQARKMRESSEAAPANRPQ